MTIKEITDSKYVPLSDLSNFGKDFIDKTKAYRRTFMEMIQMDDLSFVNIVETPKLLKERYKKNIDIKNKISIEAEENDFILEMAKNIIKNKSKLKLDIKTKNNLIYMFEKNGRDITIITSHLTQYIENYLGVDKEEDEVSRYYPELTKAQIRFIEKYRNIKKSYILKDYQELNSTSYETARKSLEKLVELKFFKKEKIGKKFIFKPIHKGGE